MSRHDFRRTRILKPGNRLYLVAMLLGLSTGGVMIYFRDHPPQAASQCKSAPQALAQTARGDVAAFVAASQPRPQLAISFNDAEGKLRRLDEFRGKTILLNLWATWCVPCREEMPALNALQKRKLRNFDVIALSLDADGADKPKKFLSENKISALPLYHDREGMVFKTLRGAGLLSGLPASFLLDADGCVLGTLAGPANWKSRDAQTLIEASQNKSRR